MAAVLVGALLFSFTPQPAHAAPPAGYYQVWNDEFDGSSLNGSKWVTFTGWHRDAQNTASALSVGGSDLTITTYTSGGNHYTGFIGTQGKFYAKYGYFEAFIDWNDAAGMWSAFWLQADPMDDCPYPSRFIGDPTTWGAEVDIVEHRSQTSSGANIANQAVSNIHWDGYVACGGNDTSTGSPLYGSGLNSGYHTYGLLWDENSYRFYVDGSQVYSTSAGLSHRSAWMVLSSEVLNGGWSGNIPGGGYGSLGSSSTKMRVAYVRYYAPNSMVFWDGSSSPYWTNSANWVAGKSVPSGGTVVFSLLGTGNFSTTLGQNYTLDTLTILETSPITINGNKLTITDQIDMNSAWNNATINSDVGFGGANTWRIGENRLLRVNGNISGGHSLTLWGYGTVALYGDNSYTLGTTVNRGVLRVASDTALGAASSGTTIASGAQLQVYSDLTSAEPVTLNGHAPAMRVSAGANATWTGTLNLGSASTIKLDGGTALAINGNVIGGQNLTLAADAGSAGIVNGNLLNGAGSVTKSGGGLWILAGTNTFSGALNVDSGSTSANDGALRVTSAGAVGNASAIQIRNNSGANAASTLQLDGSAAGFVVSQPVSLNGRNNSTPALQNLAGDNSLVGDLTMVAGGSDYRVQSDAGTLTLAGRVMSAVGSTRTLTFQGAGTFVVTGIITNGSATTFNVTKEGAGTLTLNTTNTYNGTTTINGGTLALGAGGSIANSTAVLLDGGATFDATAAGGFTVAAGRTLAGSGSVLGHVTVQPGASLIPGTSAGTLAFSNNLTLGGGVALAFELVNELTVGGGVNDLITVAGDLHLAGTNTLLLTPSVGSLVNGRYVLFQYGGALNGGATNFTVAFVGYPPVAEITVDTSVPGEIGLIVFSDPASLTWLGDGGANLWQIGLGTNWLQGIVSASFAPGDLVTFNDASPNRTVTLVEPLAAGAITVTGAGDYTFTGAGRLTGAAGLAKSGAGTLTLLTTNDYSGPTTIAEGRLQLGNGTVTGTTGTGPITDHGTLAFNHPGALTVANVISGTGNFIKDGAGVMTLTGNNSFTGGATVSGGTVNLNHGNGLGRGAIMLDDDVKRVILAADVVVTNPITLNAGAGSGTVGQGLLTGPASGTATIAGPVLITSTVAAGGMFDGGNTAGGLVLSGGITSSVPLIQRAGRVTYSGGGDFNFMQSFAPVVLGADNGLPTNAVIELGTSGTTATLDLAGFNQTLNGLVKGSGTGTVGNSSTENDATLTISGVTSNTTFAGTIQNAVSGGTRRTHLVVDGGAFTLSGANTFSGDARPFSGALVLANANALQNATLDLAEDDAGALSFGSLTSATLGGLKGTRGLGLTNAVGAAVALSVGNNFTGTNTYPGNLTGTGSLTKRGSGIFVLRGENFFTGVLNVDTAQPSSGNDGALRLASPEALIGASQIHIRNQNSATSTLQLDGSSGDLELLQGLRIACRNSSVPHLQNLAGENALLGDVSFYEGGNQLWFASDVGELTFGGAFRFQPTGNFTGARTLHFTGGGDAIVTGGILAATNSAPIHVTKLGAGTLALAGTNTYTGSTIISNGTLLVTGSLANTPVTNVAGTLGGSGSIAGPVIIQAGATLAPGTSVGVLTVGNSVSLAGTTVMELNRAGLPNNDRLVATALTYGGTLLVQNIGPILQVNDTFDLFDWTSRSGAFSSVVLPAGYAWNTNNLTVNGTISVTAVEPPPTLNVVKNSGTLDFTWTSSFNFKLQAQATTLAAGLLPDEEAWFDVPGGAASPASVPVDPEQPAMFFRLAPAP